MADEKLTAQTATTTPDNTDIYYTVINVPTVPASRKITWANILTGVGTGWGAVINALTGKTTPVDADFIALMDSADSNATKKLSWANIKATMIAAWGALINGLTGKTTPVDADFIALMDSADSNATKKLSWANIKATLKTYNDTLYNPLGEYPYGANMVWDSTTGYHVEPGLRYVEGAPLEWSSNITRSGLSPSASTFYYVYLYDNSGTPAVEESTTVPVWNSTYFYWQKTGDATRKLINGYVTNSSNAIVKFLSVLNGANQIEHHYMFSAVENLLITTTGSTGSWATIDLTGYVPAVASTHWLANVRMNHTSDGDEGIIGVDPFDRGSDLAYLADYTVRTAAGRAGQITFFGRYWSPIYTSLTSYYRTQTSAGGAITATIAVHGFRINI